MMKYLKLVLIILQWDYLPLVDNKKDATFEYSISAFTAIRSSRIMTATPFFILEGSNGSTDTRILSDAQRQVYMYIVFYHDRAFHIHNKIGSVSAVTLTKLLRNCQFFTILKSLIAENTWPFEYILEIIIQCPLKC